VNIAQTIPLADTWGMHGGDVGAGWWIVMMVFMVLFWAAVILGIVWLVRGAGRGWSAPWERPAAKETPVETLERRFAEGAISEQEYLARRKVLVSGAAHSNGADEDEALTPPRAGEGR
jgi:putative membrane protein